MLIKKNESTEQINQNRHTIKNTETINIKQLETRYREYEPALAGLFENFIDWEWRSLADSGERKFREVDSVADTNYPLEAHR